VARVIGDCSLNYLVSHMRRTPFPRNPQTSREQHLLSAFRTSSAFLDHLEPMQNILSSIFQKVKFYLSRKRGSFVNMFVIFACNPPRLPMPFNVHRSRKPLEIWNGYVEYPTETQSWWKWNLLTSSLVEGVQVFHVNAIWFGVSDLQAFGIYWHR
jgi:hypothetical protein